jgi:uncharacterized protein YcgI (DUF1989 family)
VGVRYEDYAEAMGKYDVPGVTVSKYILPAQGYVAFNLPKGQVLRCIDVEGKQVPDLVCFNAHDLSDEINLANSQLVNRQQELRQGATIVSVRCNSLMTITGYSNEYCYTYGSMCSEELNRQRYGVANTINCRDNLAAALAPWGFDRTQIPNAFVPFMRVEVSDEGTLEIREPTTVPGDYYDLRAEMDLVVGISNCPQELNPVNGFNPTPTGIVVYEPE